MMLSRSVCLLSLFMLFSLVSHAYAEEPRVFGPHVIKRGTGKPVSETHVFNATSNQTGSVSIVNGDGNGQARISSLTLMFNGVEVVSPDDFNQGVARVEEMVTLSAHNTLTIKVNGAPGSYVTLSVLGNSDDQSENPTASLTVDPDQIQSGQSAQLTWVTSAVDSVRIEPDIGYVDVEGMIEVSPEQTTTYLLTASGTSAVTSSVTLSVVDQPVPPAATLTVSPEVIHPGESAMLSWSVQNAETITLEPGFGQVAAAGSLTVSPAESTVYRLVAGNNDSVVASEAALQVLPLEPEVILFDEYKGQPLDGALVAEPQLTVPGVVAADLGSEIGVTVNGIVALTAGQRFIANHVPLAAGWNDVHVVATNPQGESVEKTVKVLVEEVSGAARLTSDWLNGLAPLTTRLNVDLQGGIKQNTFVSCYGPQTMELLPDAQGEYPVTLEEPGLYTCIADVEDTAGQIFQDRIGLQVFDATMLDAQLQQKWAVMKSALTAMDIDSAVGQFSLISREAFRARFNAMGSQLPELVSRMGLFRLVTVRENSAFYDLRTTKDGREFSFQVNFILDDDGIWRIWTF